MLNLLGYSAVAMKPGMMDWNKSHIDTSRRWDGTAGYPVETGTRLSNPQ